MMFREETVDVQIWDSHSIIACPGVPFLMGEDNRISVFMESVDTCASQLYIEGSGTLDITFDPEVGSVNMGGRFDDIELFPRAAPLASIPSRTDGLAPFEDLIQRPFRTPSDYGDYSNEPVLPLRHNEKMDVRSIGRVKGMSEVVSMQLEFTTSSLTVGILWFDRSVRKQRYLRCEDVHYWETYTITFNLNQSNCLRDLKHTLDIREDYMSFTITGPTTLEISTRIPDGESRSLTLRKVQRKGVLRLARGLNAVE